MQKFLPVSLATFAAILAPLPAAASPAYKDFDLSKYHYRAKNTSAFKDSRYQRIMQINKIMNNDPAKVAPEKDFTLGPSQAVGDCDGPNGEHWYYTGSFEYDITPPDYDAGIWYTDYKLRSFTYHVYDANGSLVGSISDNVNYNEDETKAVYFDLTPVITRNFFNTDDNYEVAIGFVMNTVNIGYNNYHTVVYSIDGSKEDGLDKPIMSFPDLIADVAEGPNSSDGRDNFYITFTTETYDETPSEEIPDGAEPDSFWDYLTRMKMSISILGRAENDEGPVTIFTEDIPLLNMPGDQESSPFMFNFTHNGEVRYAISYLEKPLWERYDSPTEGDMIQRPDNNLQIMIYGVEDKNLNLLQKTLIPAPKDDSDPNAIVTFYSIGDMRYKGDIVYEGLNVDPGTAGFYITRINYNPSSDSTSRSYYAYGNRGNKLHTYAEYCNSSLTLSDIEGFEPQQMFVMLEGGQYMMNFVNLYSNEETFSTSNYYYVDDSDEPELIMANLDRTAVGDTYMYAIEMTEPVIENDNVLLRVLWLDAEGGFERIDYVNAGTDVMYGQFYLAGNALDPDVFCNDNEKQREYLFLIKRGTPGQVLSEEVCVAQPVSETNPEGKNLLLVGPGEYGVLAGIVPYIGNRGMNQLDIYFTKENVGDDEPGMTLDVHYLPLSAGSGIRQAFSQKQDRFSFDGDNISAQGIITVYASDGSLVAQGDNKINLSELPKGMYIVTCNGASRKIFK